MVAEGVGTQPNLTWFLDHWAGFSLEDKERDKR